MIDEIAQCMLEGSRQQLLGQVNGEKQRPGIDGFISRHERISCTELYQCCTDHRGAPEFPMANTGNRVFLHPR